MGSFLDSVKSMFPLSQEKKEALRHFEAFLEEDELKELGRLLKQGKINVETARLGLWSEIAEHDSFRIFEIASHDPEVISLAESVNRKSEEHAKQRVFSEFAPMAFEFVSKSMAPNILGFKNVKEAATLQLFADESVHILLIGDTGTGKTEILLSAHDFAPVSSFGLGSGTSGIGLTVTVKGKEVHKGLLPLADKGLACIDELNLIKKEDVGSLYSAMEKGFVTYNKMGHNYRFDARASILASANPRYNNFAGKTAQQLKQELAFDAALLTRFHIIFFVRKPDVKRFIEIAKKMVSQKESRMSARDVHFVQEYIQFSKTVKVEFPAELEQRIVDFARRIKKDEPKLLVEVNPRMISGIVRMTKASARTELRKKVEAKDVERVLRIVESSLWKETQ
jgi:replicative DNA helicase Mcm